MSESTASDPLSRVIAVATNKGGTGKTSITANVAGLLAAAQMRVLAIDLDSQANLGEDLGYTASDVDDAGKAAFTAIATGAPLQPARGIRPNLDVVPAGTFTEDIASILDSRRSSNGDRGSGGHVLEALANSLAPIAGDYDVILIDCPPKGRILQEIALVAARWLIVPTKSDASSRKAIDQIADRLVAAREVNPTIDLLGVVLFGSGTAAKRLREETLRDIAADLGTAEPLFEAVIRHAEKSAAQARNSGRLIHELEEVGRAQRPWYERLRDADGSDEPQVATSVSGLAADYHQLATEIVQRVQTNEAGE